MILEALMKECLYFYHDWFDPSRISTIIDLKYGMMDICMGQNNIL